MNSETPSEPPDEPHLKSEPHLMSPASPKPMHFPAPANIPVLENMMDVGFNQTEAHMNDPAMRDTQVRPDFWRDPNELSINGDETSALSLGVHTADDATLEPNPILGPFYHDAHAPPQAANAPFLQSSDAKVAALDQDSIQASPIETSRIEHAYPSASNGNVDVQALLNSLQTTAAVPSANVAPSGESMIIATSQLPSVQVQVHLSREDSPPNSASGLIAPLSGLPPRPPPQETPLINQNYVHSQHIRDYHPHAAHSAYNPSASNLGQGNVADPAARNYVPPVPAPLSPSALAHSHVRNHDQPSPTSATYTHPSPVAAEFSVTPQVDVYQEGTFPRTKSPPSAEKPWTSETQHKYDRFLDEERKYVSEGRWEQFPMGSRLFVGNLSSEKVTKRDVFHVFHHHGDLAQISIKQAYGFVQFLGPDAAARALSHEQGRVIKDKKIHLEISKPQKNRAQNSSRRSRSPDYNRGARSSASDRRPTSRGGDRDRDRGGRDGYRPPYRSPSPRGYRERRNDRHHSRSPVDYHRSGGGRYHSPSPRRNEEDDLPLPRRQLQDVPELQIIVVDSLERDFIAWVERAFSPRGIRIDVLILSPRLSEQAVVRRQILEGVLAVSRLTQANQISGKIPLQIFDRSAGTENVKFEEYDNLDPQIAVELLLRARATQQSARIPSYSNASGYGGAQYGPQQQYDAVYGAQQPSATIRYQQPTTPGGFPPAHYAAPAQHLLPSASAAPHLQNLITALDPGSLQSLLSAMNTPQTANSGFGTPLQPPSASYPLPQAARYPHQAPPQNLGQQQQAALVAAQSNPQAFAGYFQQQQVQQSQAIPLQQNGPTQPGGAPVNMQEILARLGTYGKGP